MAQPDTVVDNFFALRNPIIERLQEKIPILENRVFAVNTLQDVIDLESREMGAVYVIFSGYTIEEIMPHDSSFITTQRWSIITTAMNSYATQGSASAMDEAGRIIVQIMNCMTSWYPKQYTSDAIQIASPDDINQYGVGYIGVPLTFLARIVFCYNILARYQK